MEGKKLSEELRYCLKDNTCSNCAYYDKEETIATICKELLQDEYERTEDCKTAYDVDKVEK